MPAGPDWLLLGQAIGVTPAPMAMPEVYLALQTGTIDGQDNPLTIMNAAKFHEVMKQLVVTSHMVQPVFYTIAKPFFDKLTPAQQQHGRDGGCHHDETDRDTLPREFPQRHSDGNGGDPDDQSGR